MRINVINVTSNKVPGKKYNQIEVAYKNDKGELKGKKFMDFGMKSGLDLLLGAKTGDNLDIEVVKEGEYWNWKGASVAGSNGSSSAPAKSGGGFSVPSRDFETKAERAARQVLIVRQSCLSTAAEMLACGAKAPATPEALIAYAEFLEEWVFSNKEKTEEIQPPVDGEEIH